MVTSGDLDGRDVAGRMSITSQVGRAFDSIPQFVTNPAQFRQVLLTLGFSYCYSQRTKGIVVPQEAEDDYKALAKLSAEINLVRSVKAVSDAGGYVALCAAIAYRAWLLRWHDSEIAAELNLTIPQVMAYTARMRRVARSHGFTCVLRKSAHLPPTDDDVEAIVAMWNENKTIREIVRALGTCRQTVKQILCDRGVITWNEPMLGPYLRNYYDRQERRGRATQENVAMYWSMGWSTKEIVQELRCSHGVYRSILKSLTKFIRHGGSGPARFGRNQNAGH
jgi:hypothetical protein